MTLQYEITPDDLHEMQAFHGLKTPLGKRARVLAALVTFILPVVLSLFSRSESVPLIQLLTIAFPVSLAAAFLIYLRYPAILRATSINVLKRGQYKYLLGQWKLSLEERGFRGIGPISESLMYWSGIEKVMETDRHLFFQYSPVLYFLIPKRAFASEADGKAFVAQVEALRAGQGGEASRLPAGSWWTQGSSAIDDRTQTNSLGSRQ